MPNRQQDASGIWWVQRPDGGWSVAVDQGHGPGPSPFDPFFTNTGNPFGSQQGTSGNTFNFPTIPTSQTTDIGGGNNGGFFNPAGGWQTGNPTGDFGTQGGGQQQPWYNSYWGQTGINTGLNLLQGFLTNQAQNKAQGQSQKQIEARIRQALAALSPEHISALAQQFLPQMGANANAAGQTAISAVREQAARTGQLEGPRALSFEAGTRAKLASDVQRQAFEGAFNLAGSQAGAITGAPYTPIQPKLGFADAIGNAANQAYQARFYQQANQNQQRTGVPFRYPGVGSSYGGNNQYGWGF